MAARFLLGPARYRQAPVVTKGLFPPGTARHGPGSGKRVAAWRARQHAEREHRINKFAEMLANGWTISAAARALNVSQQNGSNMLRDIRERLGWEQTE